MIQGWEYSQLIVRGSDEELAGVMPFTLGGVYSNATLLQALDHFGRLGWEMVSVTEYRSERPTGEMKIIRTYHFKRPLPFHPPQ